MMDDSNRRWIRSIHGWRRDLVLTGLLSGLGVVLSYLNIEVPHTPIHLEIRWVVLFLLAGTVGQWIWLLPAALLLSISGEHDIATWKAMAYNLTYAIPVGLLAWYLRRRFLSKFTGRISTALGWFALVAGCYLLIIMTSVQFWMAYEANRLAWGTWWSAQPVQAIVFEAVVSAVLVALLMSLVRLHMDVLRSREWLRRVIDRMPVLLQAFDEKGQLVYCNAETIRVTGYSQEDIRQSPEGLRLLYPDEGTLRDVQAEIAGTFGGFHSREFELTARNGRTHTIAWYRIPEQAPLPDWHNWFIGIDVTDRNAMEGRLRHAEKLDAIGRLAGGLAHDFNNQLTGILGYTHLLAETATTEEQRHCAQNVIKLADNASQLTGTQIQNALVNLAFNARDAITGEGEIRLQTANASLGHEDIREGEDYVLPGEFIRVVVSDTGCGMTDETRQHIFEPFFTTKPPGRGTGMGLASVFGTIRSHRGIIRVRSAPGRGTDMELYFPRISSPESVPEGTPREAGRAVRTILLVDEEVSVRHVVSSMLARIGHNSISASTGREAVERYRQGRSEIDLVILEMTRSRQNGADTFRTLRSIDPNAKIYLSGGSGMSAEIHSLVEEGALGFLPKPFRLTQLAEAMEKAFAEDDCLTASPGAE